MKHILYETTNLINGKKYVGLHSTDNLDDGYLGSGTAIISAIKKYTKDCFYRVILHERDTREEIIELEEKIVNGSFMARRDTYNMMTGGSNGIPSVEVRKKMSNSHKGFRHTEESKRKMSEAQKGEKAVWFGKHLPEETKRKISELKKGNTYNVGRIYSIDTIKKMSDAKKGTYHTEETKRKMSELKKGKKQPIIECPHCGKRGGNQVMKRWHFNNCKCISR